MSTETQNVDVLAMMSDVVIDMERSPFFYDDMDKARAAVAELVRAISKMKVTKTGLGLLVSEEDVADIAIALVRVGGAA